MLLAGCALTTTTTLSASPTSAVAGQAVTFTAHVTSATTPTGTVTFREGAAILGSAGLTGGTANFTTTTLSAGTHQVFANYASQGAWSASSSAAVTVTVLTAGATVINTHQVVVDGSGKIIPWNSGGPDAYTGVVRNSWNYLLNGVPTEANGLKAYFSLQSPQSRHTGNQYAGPTIPEVSTRCWQNLPSTGTASQGTAHHSTWRNAPQLPAGTRDDDQQRQLAIGPIRQR